MPPAKTPRPTATPTPGPGDIVNHPRFATDWKAWGQIYFGTEKFSVEPEGGLLNFIIAGVDTYVYSVYAGDFTDADVQIDVDVTVVSGRNTNNLSIVCRYSELGWYEFNILSGGLWTIFKYDDTNGYRELSSGGSTAIHMNNAENHLTAECIGNTLTFYINDVKVGTAKDGAYMDGTFGMSASTFEIGKLNVRFRDFTVRLADPDAELGAAVAPSVPPGFGSGGADAGAAWANYFTLPVPGETLADAVLQFDTMLDVGRLAVHDIPEPCQDIHITNTAVLQVV